MQNYLALLQDVLENGTERPDRTGTGTRSLFGSQLRFNLEQGFPLLTTKKIFIQGIIHELLWFLSGSTNVKYLNDNDIHIWDKWANSDGELGPVYGRQWRNWNGTGIDQISRLVKGLKENPYSRRHIVSAWNPAEIEDMVLPPCHTIFQLYVCEGKLSCHLYQRSGDIFLGVPFNIACYSLFSMMLAQVVGLQAKEFIHTFGDLHLYVNHIKQARQQLSREPRQLPRMKINPDVKDIFAFKYNDFTLEGYDPHPAIRAPVAV